MNKPFKTVEEFKDFVQQIPDQTLIVHDFATADGKAGCIAGHVIARARGWSLREVYKQIYLYCNPVLHIYENNLPNELHEDMYTLISVNNGTLVRGLKDWSQAGQSPKQRLLRFIDEKIYHKS